MRSVSTLPAGNAAGDKESGDLWRRLAPTFNSPIGTITITLVVVLIVGLTWVGSGFVSSANLTTMASSLAPPLLLGTCAAFALLSGVVDLSIGANAGLSAAVFAYLTLHHWNGWLAALAVLLCSVAIGLVNSWVIVTLGGSAIAATLGMLTVLSGLQYVTTGTVGGLSILLPGLFNFANKNEGPVPLVFLLLAVLVAVAACAVAWTRVGRHVRAVGGDERAAERAGISVARVRYTALILSAIGGGLTGILYIGQLGGVTDTLGSDVVFLVYAGLMIGGYSIIRGGVGNPAGGALGLLVIVGVTNIISLKAINTYYTDLIVGILLVLAVLLDRLRGGDAYE